MIRCGCVDIRKVILLEFRITELHGSFKILVVDMGSDSLGVFDGLDQRRSQDLVLADADDRRRRFGFHVEDGPYGFNTLQG